MFNITAKPISKQIFTLFFRASFIFCAFSFNTLFISPRTREFSMATGNSAHVHFRKGTWCFILNSQLQLWLWIFWAIVICKCSQIHNTINYKSCCSLYIGQKFHRTNFALQSHLFLKFCRSHEMRPFYCNLLINSRKILTNQI